MSNDLRARLKQVCLWNCLAQGGNGLHSWRCEYPERYGDCPCLDEFVDDLMQVVSKVQIDNEEE